MALNMPKDDVALRVFSKREDSWFASITIFLDITEIGGWQVYSTYMRGGDPSVARRREPARRTTWRRLSGRQGCSPTSALQLLLPPPGRSPDASNVYVFHSFCRRCGVGRLRQRQPHRTFTNARCCHPQRGRRNWDTTDSNLEDRWYGESCRQSGLLPGSKSF